MNATARAAIDLISGQRRVFFEMPADGSGIDELGALEAAIRFARRQLTDSSLDPSASDTTRFDDCPG